ncbi:MAG TPA: hypothetical protein VG389_17005 [Myxococcota bacterium]|nr:hypothetical protein [Myxococcota bacterium]
MAGGRIACVVGAALAAGLAGCGRTLPILDAAPLDGAADSGRTCARDADCDDGLACDGVETCTPQGQCAAGAPLACDDAVLCTDDRCDEPGGCTSVPNHGACPAGSLCNPQQGCLVVGCAAAAECQDAFFCNGLEVCVKGSCQGGFAPTCEDFVTCTTDACDEANDTCAHVPQDAACDDGLYCNGTERCMPPLGCLPGLGVACPDMDPCTLDLCDEPTDSCVHPPGDHDMDGFGSGACGGDDCDDDASWRYPGAPEDCSGAGLTDDDCDGLAGCDDPDCAPSPGCVAPTCGPATTAICGDTYLDNNGAPGSSDVVADWGGACGTAGDDGPEYVYTFTAADDGYAAAYLYDLTADLDLYALDAGAGGGVACDPDACLAAGATAGTGPEGVIFTVSAGSTYYLVVDGFAGATSDFTLTFFCTTM